MAAESVKFEMSFAKDQVIPQLYQIAKYLPIAIKFTFGLISIWCLLKIFNSLHIYYSHPLVSIHRRSDRFYPELTGKI
jgi:hypothetical protein